ncbi:MAG: NADPH:quinone reductase [Streptosporangiaceae bacterium]|nr:NADPH:quinone reductase [Streptosporangiaceae bacterium]
MRAVIVTAAGGPDVLEVSNRETPTPGAHDVLVDVVAAGVNFMDIYMREGHPPYARQPPFVLGSEGAGTVAAVGADVAGIAVGDAVAWTGVPGSYAEQVIIPADRAVPVPTGVDPMTAAAVMLQGCTAHYLASSTHPISADDVAVVHAAAGGVGLLLTQIVRLRGGSVVATTSGGEKAELARQAGAQHVAGYDNFVDVVGEVSGGQGASVVYDGIGQTTFDAGLAALRRRGLMVLYGAASGPVPPVEIQRLQAGGSLYLTRPTLVDYIVTREELLSRTDEIFDWISSGRLSVRIGGTYPLADAAHAHEDLAGRHTTGKLLLVP